MTVLLIDHICHVKYDKCMRWVKKSMVQNVADVKGFAH